MVGPGSDNVEDGMDYAEIGYWVLFGVGVLSVILGIAILLILCC